MAEGPRRQPCRDGGHGRLLEARLLLLEDDFELLLVNAQHVKNVPGRKTDVQDAQWLCQLLEHGLVRSSYVPPKPIRELRDLTRYRKSLVWERAREANRLHKVLEDANIKLDCVASRPFGASGKAMLKELCEGNNDPVPLADLAKGKLRAKLPLLRQALLTRSAGEGCSGLPTGAVFPNPSPTGTGDRLTMMVLEGLHDEEG
jgi:transposase